MSTRRRLLIHDAEVDGRIVDVQIEDGVITAIGNAPSATGPTEVLDGCRGALLPGLWDHHIHLLALAAARRSTPLGPPAVRSATQFSAALRAAAATTEAGGWVRGVGYHDSVAGELDRTMLDSVVSSHPVRVQHRSGALWILNTTAIQRVRLDDGPDPAVERDPTGRPTGRVFGGDDWLRARLPPAPPPDLAEVGRFLASRGVVGVTDATPFGDLGDLDILAEAASTGVLPQRVVVMGGPALSEAVFGPGLHRGPVKLVLGDHSLPGFDDLVTWIGRAHAAGRAVAAHCVTQAALALAVAAWDVAGAGHGDRVEHGAIVPPPLRDRLVELGLTVVTQPNFVVERGVEYRREVEAADLAHLYPCRSLLAAGVPVAGSTDAPFGDPDPWLAIAAATDREPLPGEPLGPDETVTARAALDLFLGHPDDPGRQRRDVRVGAPADLCLLEAGLADALAAPRSVTVRATVTDGSVVHGPS